MKQIVVTGGAGFVGSHLCERLLTDGNRVVCLDNFYTGSPLNVAHLLDNQHFKLLEHDVTVPFNLEADEFYNLACPASPEHYQKDAIQTTRTSVLGALNVLEAAKRCGAKVLQASTSEVYGDPDVHPQSESYWGNVNPVGIRSCYDEGKRCAETLFIDYHSQYNTRVKIVRIFNTYGPRMAKNDGRVVSNFIVQALENKDITIYGDGRQTRCFQYIDDLIEGLIKLMATPDDFTGPVNIGNPCEFTIRQLAEMIIRLTGAKSQIIQLPAVQDDPRRRQPDISLARQVLDWAPYIDIEMGLLRTIDYFTTVI